MQVTTIRTGLVTPGSVAIEAFLNGAVPDVPDGCVIAVTSKVVALCEGRAIPFAEGDKDRIIRQEADFYLPKEQSAFDVYLTIKDSQLIPSAGVDESNTAGHFALWPESPRESAGSIWKLFRTRFPGKKIGVIITDSSPSPLRRGVTGRCIAWCGFRALRSRIGEKDLFGRELKMTMVDVADGLAAAAVLCMGEADEGTPVAIISDLPFVEFTDAPPDDEEILSVTMEPENDLFAPLLTGRNWIRGGGGSGGDRR